MRPLSALALALALLVTPSLAFNITTILSKHPNLSSFNHYLSLTHLAGDINRRRTITVLAVDNAAMAALISSLHPSLPTLRHILSLHVLTDYFPVKRLRRAPHGVLARAATVFQSSGAATGVSGYVNITISGVGRRRRRVTFAAGDAPVIAAGEVAGADLVGPIEERPYEIAILRVSAVLTSLEADSPTPAPAPVNLTEVMSARGCREFAGLVGGDTDVAATFDASVDVGLTLFCPGDVAVRKFAPRFKKLGLGERAKVLLYHGVGAYFSMQDLKSNNGVFESMAATGVAREYNYTVRNVGEEVRLETRVDTATIVGTLIDVDPTAVYRTNKVLEPRELFRAPAPEGARGKRGREAAGPEGVGEEADVDESGGTIVVGRGGWFLVAVAGVAVVVMGVVG